MSAKRWAAGGVLALSTAMLAHLAAFGPGHVLGHADGGTGLFQVALAGLVFAGLGSVLLGFTRGPRGGFGPSARLSTAAVALGAFAVFAGLESLEGHGLPNLWLAAAWLLPLAAAVVWGARAAFARLFTLGTALAALAESPLHLDAAFASTFAFAPVPRSQRRPAAGRGRAPPSTV